MNRLLKDRYLQDSNMKRIFPLTIKYLKDSIETNDLELADTLTKLEKSNQLNEIDLEELALKYKYYKKEDIVDNSTNNKKNNIVGNTKKQNEISNKNITNNTQTKSQEKVDTHNYDNIQSDNSSINLSQLNSLYNQSKYNDYVNLFDRIYLNKTENILSMQRLTEYTNILLKIVCLTN